ncbi:von Willebrand factor type A domain-containing protein [Flavobacterium sp.]|uniref:vWA domain-containing protein n=1 Tax=Flavobacterium sp. TaxID=239 RepID=UPI0024886C10|nr:von Willebrand factor type A domain-containing protein [Flavobacterium sp.]MDI1317212.1 von Willebrand factor type A domain-containing protein [Flavobacterium sp.]
MKNVKRISLALAMFICVVSFAQEKTITGVVSDKSGPLPGANIVVKGTARGTQSDFDGKYTIKASQGEVLIFSFIAMNTSSVAVGNSSVINVVLQDNGATLSEVVVNGYGKTESKSRQLGAAQTVSSQSIVNRPNAILQQSLQGQLKGTSIALGSGMPGQANVVIRGYSSINADAVGYLKPKETIKKDAINSGIYNSNDEDYGTLVENVFESPKTAPLSTFSIDVDNASYTNIRRFINSGQKVPKEAVRVEEMVNFFKYQYPQPTEGNPFSITTEYSDCPWNRNTKLVRIGLQGKIIPTDNLPASNLVFLIDVSGSMSAMNKLPLVKESLKVLLNQLRDEDKISIVVYAGAAGLVLPSTAGNQKQTIIDALDKLQSGGSTAGGAGIELAYKIAMDNFIKDGNNRVILATDGDFNVGASSDSAMQTLIEAKRKSGVFLTCLGYGMGNYKDSKMETLADKGNGNYAYIDNIQEANRFLGKEFKGSMFAIAKDVKIQIEFNPLHVASYRLIGYENRKLNPEDFKDDAIDAGELGSGHTVTALYEIIPTGIKSKFYTEPTDLKYTKTEATKTKFNAELATVKFRYKKPDGDKSIEMIRVIEDKSVAMNNASGDLKFSSAVAWFGLKLRDSKFVTNTSSSDIKKLAKEGLEFDDQGYRAEFIRLMEAVN